MNPLGLKGPEFLEFYTIALIVASLVAAALRLYLRQAAGQPDSNALDLSPYEVAYLAGGAALTCNAALARLVHDDGLKGAAPRRRIRVRQQLPTETFDVERAVHRAADCGKDGQSVEKLRYAATGYL